MRLWHNQLIEHLPNKQLISQWKELNCIFSKQPKHILINYIYRCDKEDLFWYTMLVRQEMENRNIKIKHTDNFYKYFSKENIEMYIRDYNNMDRELHVVYDSQPIFFDYEKVLLLEDSENLAYFNVHDFCMGLITKYQDSIQLTCDCFNLLEKGRRGQKDISEEMLQYYWETGTKAIALIYANNIKIIKKGEIEIIEGKKNVVK